MPYKNPAQGKGRTGFVHYARIMAAIKRGLSTQDRIAEHLGIGPRTVGLVCADFHASGVIRCVEWCKLPRSGRYIARWAVGSGDSATHPEPHRSTRARRRSNTVAFCYLWRELESPVSMRELEAAAGLRQGTTIKLVRELRALKLVRIAGWQINDGGGDHTPLYQLGGAADAEKPPARPKAELDREAWHRRKRRLSHLRLFGGAKVQEPATA